MANWHEYVLQKRQEEVNVRRFKQIGLMIIVAMLFGGEALVTGIISFMPRAPHLFCVTAFMLLGGGFLLWKLHQGSLRSRKIFLCGEPVPALVVKLYSESGRWKTSTHIITYYTWAGKLYEGLFTASLQFKPFWRKKSQQEGPRWVTDDKSPFPPLKEGDCVVLSIDPDDPQRPVWYGPLPEPYAQELVIDTSADVDVAALALVHQKAIRGQWLPPIIAGNILLLALCGLGIDMFMAEYAQEQKRRQCYVEQLAPLRHHTVGIVNIRVMGGTEETQRRTFSLLRNSLQKQVARTDFVVLKSPGSAPSPSDSIFWRWRGYEGIPDSECWSMDHAACRKWLLERLQVSGLLAVDIFWNYDNKLTTQADLYTEKDRCSLYSSSSSPARMFGLQDIAPTPEAIERWGENFFKALAFLRTAPANEIRDFPLVVTWFEGMWRMLPKTFLICVGLWAGFNLFLWLVMFGYQQLLKPNLPLAAELFRTQSD